MQLATYVVVAATLRRQNRDGNGAAGPRRLDPTHGAVPAQMWTVRHLQGCIAHGHLRTSFARHRHKQAMPWTACELALGCGRVYRRRSAL